MDKKDLRIKELESQIKELFEKIAELERRLSLNSTNSSKPPISDGLKKVTRTKSLRNSNSKKFGGQIGHKGDTLRQTDNPDVTRNYEPLNCTACGNSLEDSAVQDTIERQEIDIIIKKQVIAHKATVKICSCGNRNIGNIPENIKAPVQFSNNVKTIAVYLTNQFISKSRIERIFSDLFGINLSDTALIKFDTDCAKKLIPFYVLVAWAVKNAAIKNADETGVRIAKKTNWLHVLCNEMLTYYRVHEKRGNMLDGITGTLVHDHWKPYFIMNVMHALCNAHHLRELQSFIEIEKESWAKEMFDLLTTASKIQEPSPEQQTEISKKYDTIIAAGLKYHEGMAPLKEKSKKKRPGHNLLLRLRDFKDDTLRFLYDKDVPFTNNLAERDLRMMKLRQKVSGCFRTFNGAETFAIIRSFVSTSSKQGQNIFQALLNVFNNTLDFSSLVPT
jgi:transposase